MLKVKFKRNFRNIYQGFIEESPAVVDVICTPGGGRHFSLKKKGYNKEKKRKCKKQKK